MFCNVDTLVALIVENLQLPRPMCAFGSCLVVTGKYNTILLLWGSWGLVMYARDHWEAGVGFGLAFMLFWHLSGECHGSMVGG